ncbi:MAG: efflux RND transporter periplasmic adaptor subunit [Deltaproteobacteria bacterium]|nr:efflux RND transporter periplasmic adaptor subunit [Deltaproteobacteria bacterium]
MKKKSKIKIIVLIIVIFIIGVVIRSCTSTEHNLKATDFEFEKVRHGRVSQSVTASGTLRPINIISVGTQVSGIIENVFADYNDKVKKGQKLAELDKTILNEDLNEAKAKLEQTKTRYNISKLNTDRNKKLFIDNYIAKYELEQAEVDLATALSDMESAQSRYNKALRNLSYAEITSPVSGTVISRQIERGQTVAASFQTPTLFEIAEDLKKMQIEASIAEADIGMINQNQEVTFTVDAHPGEIFTGKIEQIRLNPTKEQNVIMYTVVIHINNDNEKLLPGMTAFVTIKIKEVTNVLRLPNVVFQFKPGDLLKEKPTREFIKNLKNEETLVYQFKNYEVVPVKITRGLSDVSNTEIISGLQEGDEVIAEYLKAKIKKK